MAYDTEKARAEEKRYWSLLESTQQHQNPEFVSHLSNQHGPLKEEGRIAIVNFKHEAEPVVDTSIETSEDLREYLEGQPKSSPFSGRLFILEGLPKAFIQVLGSKLRIPPGFFSSHWIVAGGPTGHLINRSPRHHDNKSRFLLSFTRLHRARISYKPGANSVPLFLMESSVNRLLSRITLFGDFDGPLTSQEHVSFWSRPMDSGESKEGCWDGTFYSPCLVTMKKLIDHEAVVLVDAPLAKYVTSLDSTVPLTVCQDDSLELFDSPHFLGQRGSWYPLFESQAILGTDSNKWLASEHTPGMKSFFDDLVKLYPLTVRRSTSYPQSCTDICRRLVLSAWTAHLRVIENQIIEQRSKMSAGDTKNARNIEEHMSLAWAGTWTAAEFSRLVRAKPVLLSIEAELRRNIDALGECLSPWEKDAWHNLRDSSELLVSRLDGILENYMQAVSVRQSLNAGQLTSMATIFIPASLVAAVFSMGGKFAAGENLFWVFWVISVPLATVGCFLLFTKAGRRLFRRVSPERSLV